jgi:hypothetical protein
MQDADRKRLLERFDAAMFGVYRDAKAQAKYNATLFLKMLSDHGGYDTALRLVRMETPSVGYTALYERGYLNLTVEALVLRDPWRQLFTKDDLRNAAERLRQYRYDFSRGEII